jgi:hypothetical protein
MRAKLVSIALASLWAGLALASGESTNAPALGASTNHAANFKVVDAETRDFRPSDLFRFWVEEDPARASEIQRVSVTPAGLLICQVSAAYPDTVTVDLKGKKLADIRKELTEALEAKYYVKATVHLDLVDLMHETDSMGGSTAKAIVFGNGGLTATVPLPEGEKKWLSEVVSGLHPSEYADLARVILHRKGTIDGKPVKITVNVKNILEKDQRNLDFELRDGDRIEVKQKRFVF